MINNSESAVAASGSTASALPKALSSKELLSLAHNTDANGLVPLGDGKYLTTGAKKGYVYLCNVHKDNPGSIVNGPRRHSKMWWSKRHVL